MAGVPGRGLAPGPSRGLYTDRGGWPLGQQGPLHRPTAGPTDLEPDWEGGRIDSEASSSP